MEVSEEERIELREKVLDNYIGVTKGNPGDELLLLIELEGIRNFRLTSAFWEKYGGMNWIEAYKAYASDLEQAIKE